MDVPNSMRFLAALLFVLPAAADETRSLANTSGWRVGLHPVGQPWTYVDDGGRGEFLYLGIRAFGPGRLKADSLPESMTFRVRYNAKGLPDHEVDQTLRRNGYDLSGPQGEVAFMTTVHLAALEARWGRLPAAMSVSVALEHDGVAVWTPPMSIALKAVPRRDATWEQRVRTLRAGQSREEVFDLLGPSLQEVPSQRADGTWQTILTYPNPEAPQYLPAELRLTKIYLDARGRFRVAALHGGC